MRKVNIRRRLSLIAASLAIFGVSSVAIVLSSTPNASAVTSGIVETDLALNLDPNLSASYSGTGTTITDLSVNGRNGTLAGNTLPTFDSASPKSFEFTRAYVGNTSSTASKIKVNGNFLTDNFTIQTWIKTDQLGYGNAHYTTMYIMASECGGGAPDWGMGVNSSGKLAFGAGNSDATFATPEAVNTNAWVNVAATREKATGEIKLYINGVLKATGTGQAGNSLTCSADNSTWIGNGQDAPAYSFGGKISSVLAYTRVLNASDVLANYNATLSTFYPVTYTISYDANGATSGSVPANGSFTSGGPATTVAVNSGLLARTGYTFAGWNTSSNGNGTSYVPGTSTYSTNADVTLFATWTPVPTTTTTTTTTTSTTTTTTTTTTVAPVAVIDIQAPVNTVAVGQASVATIGPQKSTTSTSLKAATTTTVARTTASEAPLVVSSTSIAPPSIPAVETGESSLSVGGVETAVEVARENNQLVFKSESFEAVLSGMNPNGTTNPLDADGNLRLNGGDEVKINLGGFKPGSDADVWLFSTPRNLGTVTVGTDGRVSSSVKIPIDVEDGAHRIAINALLPNGKKATFTLGIAIGEISKTSTVTRVLIGVPIAAAIAFGLILPNQLRRRRRNAIL